MDAPFAQRVASTLGVEPVMSHGMPVLQIARDDVLATVRALRERLGLDMLLDLTAVDWLGQEPRFELVWHFFSSSEQQRLRLKTRVAEGDPVVPSLLELYGAAAFLERECHEMFGIRFEGNADLRPILLYEGFAGHPLRKDYAKRAEQPLVPYRTGS